MAIARPGAGLPPWQQRFIRVFLVPLVRILMTWRLAQLLFEREVRLIAALVRRCDRTRLQERVLIDRAFGIEEHSRDYSVNLVLEHLSIVGRGVQEIVATLSQERVYEAALSIEGVKPHANPAEALADFEAFAREYRVFFNTLRRRESLQTKPHPWFDAFNNRDWHIFMYLHAFIHRRQIEAIIQKMEQSA